MRRAQLPTAGLVAVLVLGVLGVPSAGIAAQDGGAVAGPATTSAFSSAPCPVEVPMPGGIEGEDFVCGLVTVPLRHGEPEGAQIQLAAIRVMSEAGSREADPVVFATGDAGDPGLDLAQAAPTLAAAFEGRDIILFAQRGSRHSEPFLHCDERDPVALAQLTGQVTPEAALDQDLDAYSRCAARFAAAGTDLSAFNSLESAADVRDVVTALGYTEYDFVGTSHGTRIGQALLRDVPTGLRSAVLDSVEPTTVATQAQRAARASDVLGALFGACAAEEACSVAHPDLEQTLLATMDRLTASPVHVPVAQGDATLDVVVTGEGLLRTIVERLDGTAEEIDAIPAFIAQVAGGDLAAVAESMVAVAVDPDRADGLAYAIRCSEDQVTATDDAPAGVPSQFHFLAGWVGSRDSLAEICSAMGLADAGATIHEPALSDVPVLTVSGEFDPFSPASYADAVRSDLGSGYGLEFPGVGRGVLLSADCPTAIMAGFIADPTREPDAACIADMPEFATSPSTPDTGPSTAPEQSPRPETSPGPDKTPEPDRTQSPVKAPRAKPVKVGLVKVADGFENANGINNAGDRRLFVSEQEGYVVVLKPNKDGTFRNAGTFLDIRSRVVCCGEKGFLGIAFPPDYAQTGLFYITFAGTGHTWNLEERRVSDDDPDRADPTYKRRLIRIYKPLDYHWAGDMHFGADGFLYVTVGDGGFGGTPDDPGDPENRAQDLGVIFGKMLRIDPRGSRKDGDRYGVPRSNPFVKKKGAQPEIWAYGLRNPWRWSFDRLTNDLWIGDVGMWTYEEINRAASPGAGKGDNFGWRRMEGPVCYNPRRRCDTGELTAPFAWIPHRNGSCAVVGGYVYRGRKYPRLRSWYVFGDYCSGRIMLLDSAGKAGQKPRTALDTKANISAFGEGSDGELYMVDYGPGNTLYRVTGSVR